MTEETTPQEEPPKEEPKEESKPMSDLSEQVDKLKLENDRTEALVKRQEELVARKLLGGDSTLEQPPEKKEESPSEYKDRVMKGDVNEGKN